MITATHDEKIEEKDVFLYAGTPHTNGTANGVENGGTKSTTNGQAQDNGYHVTDNDRKFFTGFQDWRLKDSPPKEHVYPEISNTRKERNIPPTPTELEISLELARYGISPLEFTGVSKANKPQTQRFILRMLKKRKSKEEALEIITKCREELL
jgi:hypothetical protein